MGAQRFKSALHHLGGQIPAWGNFSSQLQEVLLPQSCQQFRRQLALQQSAVQGCLLYTSLSRRMKHTTSKSIRGRLMSYFSECAKQFGSSSFIIPYNRQQLADYLGVDRSTMCNELSKMQRDGIIEYEKNRFLLKMWMLEAAKLWRGFSFDLRRSLFSCLRRCFSTGLRRRFLSCLRRSCCHPFRDTIQSLLCRHPYSCCRIHFINPAVFQNSPVWRITGCLLYTSIADYLTGDNPVYIYGSNLSSVPAKYLQVVLNTLDHPSILIEWHRLLAGLIHEITSDSVLFMISAHGDSQRYLPIFECAKKRGITTILLTSEKNSPLLSLSTIWMCSNDQNEECHHVDINSRLGIITLIQLIIELAAQGTICLLYTSRCV